MKPPAPTLDELIDAGNLLWHQLEMMIQNNSGFCSPQDVEAIDRWIALVTPKN